MKEYKYIFIFYHKDAKKAKEKINSANLALNYLSILISVYLINKKDLSKFSTYDKSHYYLF